MKCVREAVEFAFGFTAKLEQTHGLRSLVFNRENTQIQRYEKIVVPQLLPLLMHSSIVIILLPGGF
jgi:hypothetical protein